MLSTAALHSRAQSADSLVSTIQPLQNNYNYVDSRTYKHDTSLVGKSQSSSHGHYDNIKGVKFEKNEQNSRNTSYTGNNNYTEYSTDRAGSQRNTSYSNDNRNQDFISNFQRNRSSFGSGLMRDVEGEGVAGRGSTRARPSMGVSGSMYSKKYHSTESIAPAEGETRQTGPVGQLENAGGGNPVGGNPVGGNPRGGGGGMTGLNTGYHINKEGMDAGGTQMRTGQTQIPSSRRLEHSATRSANPAAILSASQHHTTPNFNHTAGNTSFTTTTVTSPAPGNPIKSPLSPAAVGNSTNMFFSPAVGDSRMPLTSLLTENPALSSTVSYHANSVQFSRSTTSAQNLEPGIITTQASSAAGKSLVKPTSNNHEYTLMSPRNQQLDSRSRNPTQNRPATQNRQTVQGRSIPQRQTTHDHHVIKQLVPGNDASGMTHSRNNKSVSNQPANQVDEIDANRAVRSRVSRSSSALGAGGRQAPRVGGEGNGGRLTHQPPTGRPVNPAGNGGLVGNGSRQTVKLDDRANDNKQQYQFKASVRASSNNRSHLTSNQASIVNTTVSSPQKKSDRLWVTNNNNSQVPSKIKSSVNEQLRSQGKKAISTMELNRNNNLTYPNPVSGYHRRDKSLPSRDTDTRKSGYPSPNALPDSRAFSTRQPSQHQELSAAVPTTSGAVENNPDVDRRTSPNRKRLNPERDAGAAKDDTGIIIHPATLGKSSLTHYFSNPELNVATAAPEHNVEIRRLRRMLADKDYELASVRETFAENEKSILRVLEERSRSWRQESSARQMEWERSLSGHIERSLQHDASMRGQLADSQQETQKTLSDLHSVKEQLSELQEKYDKLKVNYESVVTENERLNQIIGISSMVNSNFSSSEKLHENGKLGVWSVISKTAPVEMIEGNAPRKQVMFKPINDFINEESSQFDTSSESDVGSLCREVKFKQESNRGSNEFVFPKQESDHAQILTAAELVHPGFRATPGPRRLVDYSTPSNSSLSSSSNSQHSRDGATGSKFSGFTRQQSSSSSSTSRHSRDGASEFFPASREDDNHGTTIASNRRSRRVTFGSPDDEQSSVHTPPVPQSVRQNDRWNGNTASRETDATIEQRMKSLNSEAEQAKKNLEECKRSFDNERERWLREKDQVINYQTTLQQNYMQVLNRNRALEQELSGIRGPDVNL